MLTLSLGSNAAATVVSKLTEHANFAACVRADKHTLYTFVLVFLVLESLEINPPTLKMQNIGLLQPQSLTGLPDNHCSREGLASIQLHFMLSVRHDLIKPYRHYKR